MMLGCRSEDPVQSANAGDMDAAVADTAGADASAADAAEITVVTSQDGRLRLEIPAGATPDPSVVRIERLPIDEAPDGAADSVDAVYDLLPDGLQFSQPVRVELQLGFEDLPIDDNIEGVPVYSLMLENEDGSLSPLVPPENADPARAAFGTNYDFDARTVTLVGALDHFSKLFEVNDDLIVWIDPRATSQRPLQSFSVVTTLTDRVPDPGVNRLIDLEIRWFSGQTWVFGEGQDNRVQLGQPRQIEFRCGRQPGEGFYGVGWRAKRITTTGPGVGTRDVWVALSGIATCLDEPPVCRQDQGAQCITDANCRSGQTCLPEPDCACVCAPPAAGATCGPDVECGPNKTCNLETCQCECVGTATTCNSDASCEAPETCDLNRCMCSRLGLCNTSAPQLDECASDADCPANSACQADGCLCACSLERGAECAGNSDCPGPGQTCNFATCQCEAVACDTTDFDECARDEDCPALRGCNGERCECECSTERGADCSPTVACEFGGTCNLETCRCQLPDTPTPGTRDTAVDGVETVLPLAMNGPRFGTTEPAAIVSGSSGTAIVNFDDGATVHDLSGSPNYRALPLRYMEADGPVDNILTIGLIGGFRQAWDAENEEFFPGGFVLLNGNNLTDIDVLPSATDPTLSGDVLVVDETAGNVVRWTDDGAGFFSSETVSSFSDRLSGGVDGVLISIDLAIEPADFLGATETEIFYHDEGTTTELADGFTALRLLDADGGLGAVADFEADEVIVFEWNLAGPPDLSAPVRIPANGAVTVDVAEDGDLFIPSSEDHTVRRVTLDASLAIVDDVVCPVDTTGAGPFHVQVIANDLVVVDHEDGAFEIIDTADCLD